MGELMSGQARIAGDAAGGVLASRGPLSFWGGYDYRTGEIIDRRHPLSGQIATGRVLALPNTIGSSTTTAVLLEAIRAGTAPAAILTIGVDSFLALASVVSNEMYGRSIPLVALEPEQFQVLLTGTKANIGANGRVQVH